MKKTDAFSNEGGRNRGVNCEYDGPARYQRDGTQPQGPTVYHSQRAVLSSGVNVFTFVTGGE